MGRTRKNAENKLISDLTYADILIIDDFGAESGKDWINENSTESSMVGMRTRKPQFSPVIILFPD